MSVIADNNLLILLVIPLIFFGFSVSLMLRARTMRALAASSGLQYVGPQVPRWFGLVRIKPRLAIPRNWYPANEIWQAWNVIEGERGGVRVLIFDGMLYNMVSTFCTFVACQTESNPFEKDEPGERILKSRDWRILYSTTTLIPWAMSTAHLERHLNELCSTYEAG